MSEDLERQAAPERVKRIQVPEMDAMLGAPFRVLDSGFVRVIDYMGTDASVVQAARVSYGAGTRKINEDRGLIRYLMRHFHTTPFEMCEIKLHVRIPMDAWRQYIRHRTANVNEYSTRYSIAIDECQETAPHAWRLQAKGNRQGSDGLLDAEQGKALSLEEAEFHAQAHHIYKGRLAKGVAREQARKDLPLSNYTEAYWKVDLHNLFHFLALRMDRHAQKEIRDYANVIGREIVAKWCPQAWEAFIDYRLEAMRLSRLEILVLTAIVRGGGKHDDQASQEASGFGWTERDASGKLKKNREREEFEVKLERMGIALPWTH